MQALRSRAKQLRDALTSKLKKSSSYPMSGGKKVLDLFKLNRSDAAEKATLAALLKNSAYRLCGKDPFGNGASPFLLLIYGI